MRRRSRATDRREAFALTLLVVLGCGVGCRGENWSLGEHEVAAGGAGGALDRESFSKPVWLEELTSDANQDDASLTADQLEIFFASTRDGGVKREDVWMARRSSVADAFSEPELVEAVSSEDRETAAAISADGLTLWFASDRDDTLGGLDIWSASRASREDAFEDVVHHPELSTEFDDLPRAPSADGEFLPIAVRLDETDYDLHLAELTESGEYGNPIALEELNTEHLEGDATLVAGGLMIVFASDRDDPEGDLYMSVRAHRNDEFSEPVALDELNSDEEESDPWISGDGKTLFFSSKRRGSNEIFKATR